MQKSDNELISKKEIVQKLNNISSECGIYNGITLHFGSIYIEHYLLYLRKIKKFAIFTVQQNLSKIEFINKLISPNNLPNKKDNLTAQIMLKNESLKYRIKDLEKNKFMPK